MSARIAECPRKAGEITRAMLPQARSERALPVAGLAMLNRSHKYETGAEHPLLGPRTPRGELLYVSAEAVLRCVCVAVSI